MMVLIFGILMSILAIMILTPLLILTILTITITIGYCWAGRPQAAPAAESLLEA